MKTLSLVGARPQFVKAAMLTRAILDRGCEVITVHSGQHYDGNMSGIFFDELGIPQPDLNLEVGSGSHAFQTGETMMRLESACRRFRPDIMVLYGDTNTTLAGALVAAKLAIPCAHVEAGLRSFDRTMPEEINRIVADRLSRWLFCPTQAAVDNLAAEGMRAGVHCVGDVMYDAAVHFTVRASERSRVLDALGLAPGAYILVTIHRDFNTDDEARLRGILDGLRACGQTCVFPVHPRVRGRMAAMGVDEADLAAHGIAVIPPVGYLDMVSLERSAALIVTDSGGVQKEAYFHRVPCVTVRPNTEWVETVDAGWNCLVEPRPAAMAEAVRATLAHTTPRREIAAYGDGHAARQMAAILLDNAL